MNIPQLIAHRGWPARYPENSREGIEAALAAGAPCVEVDVQVTADGVPVLLHDGDLERVAGVAGKITEMDRADAARACIGEAERFGDAFAQARLPDLADLVGMLERWPRATAFVEIKSESLAAHGVDAVMKAVGRALKPAIGRCVLISYDVRVMSWANFLHAAGTGWVVGRWDGAAHVMASELAPDYLFCNWTKLPPAPAPLWSGPWRWAFYDVTDPAHALELGARGADLIETMDVGAMLADPQLARLKAD